MKLIQRLGVLLITLLLVACGPSAEKTTATNIAEIVATASPTSAPTATPLPLPTATPIPYDLSVQVTDEEGNFFEAALVSITEQDTSQTTDANGETNWHGLQVDNVHLSIYVQGYIPVEEMVTLERGKNNSTIQLERDLLSLQLTDVVAEGEELLFIEDFQDGKDGFEGLIGDWQIIEADDAPGNQVIQINQKDNPVDLAVVSFGPDKVLDNFIVEYKFRYIETVPFTGSEWQSVGLDFWNRYAVDLYTVNNGMYQLFDYDVNPWLFPVQVNRAYQMDRWYTVRVEVTSPEVNLYLNDSRMARYRNLQEAAEGENNLFTLYAMPHCLVQIDDIVLKIPAP